MAEPLHLWHHLAVCCTVDVIFRVPAEDQALFTAAAARWKSIVTQGLPPESTAGILGGVPCDLPELVDDLFVCATYDTYDGAGGSVGGGRVISYRLIDDELPAVGVVSLDVADISALKARGILDDLILRSLGRGVGVGYTWPKTIQTVGNTTTCTYNGASASAEYQAISGCSGGPPLDTVFTDCLSWSEDCFGTELFTGINIVDNQTSFPLSRMTIASLQDAGYSVDLSQADAFGRADLNPNCTCGGGRSLRGTAVQKSTPPRRSLSPEGHQKAVLSGKKLLADAKKKRALAGHPENNDASVKYAGDEMVTIFYMENDHIFDVVVHSDE